MLLNDEVMIFGDIGGTNSRFLVVDKEIGLFLYESSISNSKVIDDSVIESVIPKNYFKYKTSFFLSSEDMISRVIEDYASKLSKSVNEISIKRIYLFIASVKCKDSNGEFFFSLKTNNILFDKSVISEKFNTKVFLENDFVPYHFYYRLKYGLRDGSLLIIGPGTGLGKILLFPKGNLYVCSEDNRNSFSFEVLSFLKKSLDIKNFEEVCSYFKNLNMLSGRGLCNIYCLLNKDECSVNDVCFSEKIKDQKVWDIFSILLGLYVGDSYLNNLVDEIVITGNIVRSGYFNKELFSKVFSDYVQSCGLSSFVRLSFFPEKKISLSLLIAVFKVIIKDFN